MRYEMATIADALYNFILCRHKDGESLLDCTYRFKVAPDVLALCAGGLMCLSKQIVDHLDYDTSDNDKLEVLNKESDERLAIYFYLINFD